MTLPPYALLALDVDGTLLDGAKRITPRTLAALHAARRRGLRLVLVTGRRYPAVRAIAEELGGDIPLVLHNGALVVDAAAGGGGPVVLRCRPLAAETARLALALSRDDISSAVLHCGLAGEGRLVATAADPANTLLSSYLERSKRDLSGVEDLLSAVGDDLVQVMFAGRLAAMTELHARLLTGLGQAARVDRTYYPRSGFGILDVLHPEVGKADALAFLRRHLGVPREQTLAIGDNWNDHEMLEQAGRGLVMGNAEAALLALGFEVLPTNEEEGVAEAVERYVLGARH